MPQSPILDEHGNPYDLPKTRQVKDWPRPIRSKDWEHDYAIKGWDPDTVWSAYTSAHDGDTSHLQTLFELALRTQSRVYALDQRRRGSVVGLEWEWRPYREGANWETKEGRLVRTDPEYTAQDIENANLVDDVILRIPNIQDHARHAMGGIPHGFAVHQIRWVEAGGVMRPFLRALPQRMFTWQRKDSEQVIATDWPRILTDAEPTFGEDLDPNRYLVTIYRDAAEPHRCGLMWPCIWLALRDWELWSQSMATGERFSEPPLIAFVDPRYWNSDLTDYVMDALGSYGRGMYGVMPGSGKPLSNDENEKEGGTWVTNPQTDIRIPQAFWSESRAELKREMSILWTSGNLTTDNTGGTGSLANAQIQREGEKDAILSHDVDWLTMGWFRRLAELTLLMNKGPEAAARVPALSCPGLEDSENVAELASTFKTAGETNWDNVRGMPQEAREALELPEMAEGENDGEEPPDGNAPPGPPGNQPEEPQGAPGEPDDEPAPPRGPRTIEERAESILETSECSCGDTFTAAEAGPPGANDLKRIISEILERIEPFTDEANEQIRDRVTAHLLRMKNPPKTAAAFQRAMLAHVEAEYATIAAELESAGMGEWFADTYQHYKTTDRSIWPKGKAPASISFGDVDEKVMAHMDSQVNWYFSKFTDNATYREPMTKFLAKTYSEDGAQLFVRNKEVVDRFATKLGETTKELADHEIDRIARTTIARGREDARIMQMSDAGVRRLVVRTHPDACPICKPYDGKVIDVQSAVDDIEYMASLEGEAWEEAAKARTKDAKTNRGVPPHEFSASDGAGQPIYHPNCRCGVEMELD